MRSLRCMLRSGSAKYEECNAENVIVQVKFLLNVDICIYLSVAASLYLSVCLTTITSINSSRQRQRKWTEQQHDVQHDATSGQIRGSFHVDYADALSTSSWKWLRWNVSFHRGHFQMEDVKWRRRRRSGTGPLPIPRKTSTTKAQPQPQTKPRTPTAKTNNTNTTTGNTNTNAAYQHWTAAYILA